MRAFGLLASMAVVLASVACSTGDGDTSSTESTEPGHPAESTQAAPPAPPAPATAVTDFRNVKIFDGHSDRLSAPSNVRVKGNRIQRISTERCPTSRGPR
ncbi:hypothetical protein BN970_00841 [Mycolicibacterium conceptionense]|uniref:Uncharacterized protein n=1 Tax=Mycolicibacterium conceptionense TaxID=451644 RepID=A0A0U1D0P8_9MYCO|nr:hypothetical protein BN970_00841 [Mycolicibacterium conceptionense]